MAFDLISSTAAILAGFGFGTRRINVLETGRLSFDESRNST